jgi:integrase/recombinase XerD
MTGTPISPLRQRMIEDMTIRKFAARTQEGYIRCVKNFSNFLGASPAKARFEDIRRYQLHLASNGAGAPTINHTLTALRFLFMVTLRKPDAVMRLPFVRKPQKLPVVLSPDEVQRLLEAAPGLKYKAALSVAYGAGLRASEVLALKISDIDSARMMIRVEQGKGKKDRYVMLSPHLLDILRLWWKAARPQGWLFPGQNRIDPLSARQFNRACHAAAEAAGIGKPICLHTLRHSFATHLLEQNVDIRVIQVLMGHAKLDTTALYTRVATKAVREVTSPLERLTMKLTPPA